MWRWRLLPAERPYGRNRTYALTSKRPTRVSLMYSMGIFAHPAGLDVRRKWYNFGKKKKVSLDFRGNLSWRQETKTLVWDKSAAGIRDFPFAPEDWTVHRFESGQRDSGPRRMSYHSLRSDLAPWKKRGGGKGGETAEGGGRGQAGRVRWLSRSKGRVMNSLLTSVSCRVEDWGLGTALQPKEWL